jgi:hypothetical protein
VSGCCCACVCVALTPSFACQMAWRAGGRLLQRRPRAALGLPLLPAAAPPVIVPAHGRAGMRQQKRAITINGRYYDPFHPLHIMGMLTVMLAGGCVKMILERRERVKVREEYERQLAAADREAEATAKDRRQGDK